MKWKNKGHEFDNYWNEIKSVKEVYIFGAGLIGKSAIMLLEKDMKINAVLDNANSKLGHKCSSYEIISPNFAQKNIPVIVCVPPEVENEVEAQLSVLGLHFFDVHIFIPVYFMYKYSRLVITSISYLPTTVCNLKCKNCLNFAPYLKHQEFRNIDTLKDDIDNFFGKVDYVMLFHVSGGEPLLYPDIGNLLSYIREKYGDRIARLETTTNGTVVPSEKLCNLFHELSIGVVLDDYTESLPEYKDRFKEIVHRFDGEGVDYRVQKADKWISLMTSDYLDDSFSLNEKFEKCHVPWQEYRDGKLYLCNYSDYAAVAGLYKVQDNEYLCIENAVKKEIMEFRLGFSEKGYTGFCAKCAGYLNNGNYVTPAEQV